MTLLKQQTCRACDASATDKALLLNQDQAIELLKQLKAQSAESDNWQLVEEQGIQKLTAEFATKRYKKSMLFVNQIADLAESVNHHPLMLVEYGLVGVQWWSHNLKGLSQNDFIMAAKTSAVFAEMAERKV